ncbi:hypothetical protein BEN47_11070 [Hymenobacter lapidarius]|uniref:MalT-like TPR region domain-containing protein n=1 Tax=Hymenobacter lapidarius TaxID=1908237 RepID=A0A1G1T912_9BACT|nr:hypothetical protein [Hymenobacter lapidarius]OGX87344.1 hypothetical protein BEN47_11070 [Hymenobacter lapidarius]
MPFFLLNLPPRSRWGWLLPLLLLLLGGPLAAQTTPAHRYWEADGDSLRRVLDTQRADTARLRTLLQLYDALGDSSPADLEARYRELAQLTRRLRRPDAAAFRLSYAALQLNKVGKEPARELDSLRAVVEAFDRLGRPIPEALSEVWRAFRKLKQREAQIIYFEAKLAQYQARGAQENMAMCHFALGSPFVTQGDYNRGISHYLQSADLASAHNRYSQENQLKVAGTYYAEWGNPAKALYYLRQSLAVNATLPQRYGFANAYTFWGMAQAYRQLHDYPAALRYANLALLGNTTDTTRNYAAQVPVNSAYGLVVKSAVLLDMRRVAEAEPLLARAQQLADSLKLALRNSGHGIIELDATWAR